MQYLVSTCTTDFPCPRRQCVFCGAFYKMFGLFSDNAISLCIISFYQIVSHRDYALPVFFLLAVNNVMPITYVILLSYKAYCGDVFSFLWSQSSGSLATSCHTPQRKSSSTFPSNISKETDLWDNYAGDIIPPQIHTRKLPTSLRFYNPCWWHPTHCKCKGRMNALFATFDYTFHTLWKPLNKTE